MITGDFSVFMRRSEWHSNGFEFTFQSRLYSLTDSLQGFHICIRTDDAERGQCRLWKVIAESFLQQLNRTCTKAADSNKDGRSYKPVVSIQTSRWSQWNHWRHQLRLLDAQRA